MNAPVLDLKFGTSRRGVRVLGVGLFRLLWVKVLLWTLVLCTAVGGVLLIFVLHQRIGVALLGLSIWPAMLLVWAHWGMREFSGLDSIASGTQYLDELLSADLVRPMRSVRDLIGLKPILEKHWQSAFILQHFQLPMELLATDKTSLERVYEQAYYAAREAGQRRMTAGSLAVGWLLASDVNQTFLGTYKLQPEDLVEGLVWLNHFITDRLEKHFRQSFGGIGRDFAAGYTNYLDRFGSNISGEVEAGAHIYSTLGREPIVEQLIETLDQTSHSAVALVGPYGGGKTTLLYSFAEALLTRPSSGRLTYRKVMLLSPTALTASATPEMPIERIMSELLADAVRAKNVVLFFDDAQLFFETKPGSVDITSILLPIMQNNHVPMIFAFTDEVWTRFSQTQAQVIGLMTKITLPAADEVATLRTLEDVALDREVQDQVLITYAALLAARDLSDRYATTKAQPARSLDLLESAVRFAENSVVTAASVSAAIEQSTGIKSGTAEGAEAQQLLHLEALIHDRMVNQSVAVAAVSSALRRARAGVRDTNRPIGSFLFLGPTGVGKTELAKSLAATYFGGEEKMVRLDMSEYQQPTDTSRLLAAASEDGAGSSFLASIRQQPYSVVLLDEIEKAHPDILNLILQLLDEGRLTDSAGQPASFKECIIILTSNAAADDIRQYVARGEDLTKVHDAIIESLIHDQIFKPELLNRFDEIVMFRPLTKPELKEVVGIMLRGLNATLAAQKMSVELTDAATEYIVEQGNDPRMGARPMRRALQHYVEDRLSQAVLAGQISPGAKIVIDGPAAPVPPPTE